MKNLPVKHTAPLSSMSVASHLYLVQQQKAALEEQEKELKAELLGMMKGIKSVKTDEGVWYVKEHRESLVIKDETKAKKWLDENNCYKPDMTRAKEICRRSIKLPKFFAVKVGEPYLVIKRPS